MHIELTPPQQQLLDQEKEHPLLLVDPRTNESYILIHIEEYEQLQALLQEDKLRKAISRTAVRNAVGRMNEKPHVAAG